MCAPALGIERQNAVTQQNRQQNDHADGGADKDQLMEGISTAQHFDHGVHDRDAEHREQQIKNGFEVQAWFLVAGGLTRKSNTAVPMSGEFARDSTPDTGTVT